MSIISELAPPTKHTKGHYFYEEYPVGTKLAIKKGLREKLLKSGVLKKPSEKTAGK